MKSASVDMSGLKYEIIHLSWYKRRNKSRLDKVKVVSSMEVKGFKKEAGSLCDVFVSFDDELPVKLTGQVGHNTIKGTWSVNALGKHGDQVAIRLL